MDYFIQTEIPTEASQTESENFIENIIFFYNMHLIKKWKRALQEKKNVTSGYLSV